MRIEVLLDLKTRLGESPVWDVEQQRLWWVDSLDGRLFACNAQGGAIKSWDVRQKIGSFALRQNGEGAVVALQNGVHLLDFASGELTLLHHPEADRPFNRLNDGKVDRQGRFLFGSMDMREEEPSGALYRLDPDLSLHVLKKDIIVSNAPCWSPSGETFYFADTWTGEICAWDYNTATGDLSGERVFCHVDRSEGGAADGATVDSEGYLWNALVYAGKLVRYTPEGKVDRIIEMPVKKVTSVMFGGENLDVLQNYYFHNDVATVLQNYFHYCSLEMSCVELARTFLFLADRGIAPHLDAPVIAPIQSRQVNALMMTSGMYQNAGEFAWRVGLPAKSGVGGGIVAIVPQEMAIAVWSPELDDAGNSLAGVAMLEKLTQRMGRSVF